MVANKLEHSAQHVSISAVDDLAHTGMTTGSIAEFVPVFKYDRMFLLYDGFIDIS